ncbi:MAG: hypothetical protein O2782_22030 [bacterium]|nr:hypothetical protein [bacterium]
MMELPEALDRAVAPLFKTLPLEDAMFCLIVTDPVPSSLVGMVETILRDAAVREQPALQSALWLYIDDLDRSHTVSQGIEDATGSFWHGIMHRREGDFANSHHWFNKVGEHPAITHVGGYEPHRMIDEVDTLHTDNPQHLINLQRREWQTLFAWSATQYRA